jgi:hypothetical protein
MAARSGIRLWKYFASSRSIRTDDGLRPAANPKVLRHSVCHLVCAASVPEGCQSREYRAGTGAYRESALIRPPMLRHPSGSQQVTPGVELLETLVCNELRVCRILQVRTSIVYRVKGRLRLLNSTAR